MNSKSIASLGGLLIFALIWSFAARFISGSFASESNAVNQGSMYLYAMFALGWVVVALIIAGVMIQKKCFPTVGSKIWLGLAFLFSLAIPYFVGLLRI